MEIGKIFTFAGAHWLPTYDGKCNQCHGHEWKLKVVLRKRIDKKTGMVLDFSILKQIVKKYIIDKLDHTIINDVLDNPTAENLCVWIWEKLMIEGQLKGIHKISVWETSDSVSTLDVEGMLSILITNIEKYVKS